MRLPVILRGMIRTYTSRAPPAHGRMSVCYSRWHTSASLVPRTARSASSPGRIPVMAARGDLVIRGGQSAAAALLTTIATPGVLTALMQR